jgi:hypothetical protein
MPRGVKRVAEDDAPTTSRRTRKTAKTSHEEDAPKAIGKSSVKVKETKGKKV